VSDSFYIDDFTLSNNENLKHLSWNDDYTLPLSNNNESNGHNRDSFMKGKRTSNSFYIDEDEEGIPLYELK